MTQTLLVFLLIPLENFGQKKQGFRVVWGNGKDVSGQGFAGPVVIRFVGLFQPFRNLFPQCLIRIHKEPPYFFPVAKAC